MGKGVICLAGCLFALLISAAPAQASLYWFDSFLSTSNIASAGLGGGADQTIVSGVGDPGGITADEQFIYWTTRITGRIGRALPDGTGREDGFVTGVDQPSGIAVSDTHIYWSEPFRGYIGRANLDGTGVNRDFIETVSPASDLAVEGGYLYWAATNTVGRAGLDGSQVNRNFLGTLEVAPASISIATSSEFIFVGFEDGLGINQLSRARFDGSGFDRDFTRIYPDRLSGLAASESFVYVAVRSGVIERVNLKTGDSDPTFVEGLSPGPRFLALNGAFGRIESSPSELSFPSQRVGTLSPFRQVEYENTGFDEVRIDDLRLDKAEDFLITGESCPASLAPGESCLVTVRFVPGSAGQKTDTLQLLTGSEGETATPLTGFGEIPTGPPSIRTAGRAGRASLKVKLACGSAAPCSLALSGGLGSSARPAFPARQVSLGAGRTRTVTIAYGARLKNRIAVLLRRGSRPVVVVRARDASSKKTSQLRIAVRR